MRRRLVSNSDEQGRCSACDPFRGDTFCQASSSPTRCGHGFNTICQLPPMMMRPHPGPVRRPAKRLPQFSCVCFLCALPKIDQVYLSDGTALDRTAHRRIFSNRASVLVLDWSETRIVVDSPRLNRSSDAGSLPGCVAGSGCRAMDPVDCWNGLRCGQCSRRVLLSRHVGPRHHEGCRSGVVCAACAVLHKAVCARNSS